MLILLIIFHVMEHTHTNGKSLIDVVIFGTGGHARVVYDLVLKSEKYQVAAFVSNQQIDTFLGIKHIHESQLPALGVKLGVVAIGDNWIRSKVVDKVKNLVEDFDYVTLVHPSVSVGLGAEIGKGTVVMAGSTVNPFAKIGDHIILNTHSSVDHECEMGDFSSLAPGCVLGGNVFIGAYTAVSIGARIIHGIKIGEHTVIGAGSIVVEDHEPFSVYYGTPSKRIRERTKGEEYLAKKKIQ